MVQDPLPIPPDSEYDLRIKVGFWVADVVRSLSPRPFSVSITVKDPPASKTMTAMAEAKMILSSLIRRRFTAKCFTYELGQILVNDGFLHIQHTCPCHGLSSAF